MHISSFVWPRTALLIAPARDLGARGNYTYASSLWTLFSIPLSGLVRLLGPRPRTIMHSGLLAHLEYITSIAQLYFATSASNRCFVTYTTLSLFSLSAPCTIYNPNKKKPPIKHLLAVLYRLLLALHSLLLRVPRTYLTLVLRTLSHLYSVPAVVSLPHPPPIPRPRNLFL